MLSTNFTERTLIEIGSKWSKKQKRWSKVRESKLLDGEIKEDRSPRNMDRGQLSKRKKPPIDALDHLMGKNDGQAGEALKMWVKLT